MIGLTIMNEPLPSAFKQLTLKADEALSHSETILKAIAGEETQIPENTTIDKPQQLQLILQYRLDTQDALAKILQMHQGLLQMLGITPQQSSKMNLDRLEYALGNDDLHQILGALSLLVHSLSRVAHRYQQSLKKASIQRQAKPALREPQYEARFQKAVVSQKEFLRLIDLIQLQLAKPSNEPNSQTHAHTDTTELRIKTEKWFNLLKNNLKLSHQCYEKINKTLGLDHQLSPLLKKVDMILEQLPAMNQPHPFFTPPPLNITELEQRASAKRLRPFFNH